jgi:hypothetical protein
LAIESELLETVRPQYVPDDSGDLQPTYDYARQLLAVLKAADSSQRPLKEILADARRFRDWVDGFPLTTFAFGPARGATRGSGPGR